jgi:hypothetical protein
MGKLVAAPSRHSGPWLRQETFLVGLGTVILPKLVNKAQSIQCGLMIRRILPNSDFLAKINN